MKLDAGCDSQGLAGASCLNFIKQWPGERPAENVEMISQMNPMTSFIEHL